MGNEARSAVGYRVQIRATVGTPASGDDIQNIDTAPLPNGALCLVLSNRSLYELAKNSSEMVSNPRVVAPIAGGGRWKLMTGPAGTLGAVLYSNAASNDFATNGSWQQVSTAQFNATLLSNGAWALTQSGGILTYQGPPAAFAVSLSAAVRVADATPAQQVFGGISYNNDLTGALAVGGPESGTAFVQDVDGSHAVLSTHRMISEVLPGHTFRPKFGAATEGVSGTVMSLQMLIQPL